MALDEDLHWPIQKVPRSGRQSTPGVRWGNCALRLRRPLTTLFAHLDEDINDWVSEDLPETFGLIGPAAIPALRDFLADATHGEWSRAAASNSLVKIAQCHSPSRDEVIAILCAQLAHFAEQDRNLNACLVADLAADLRATEAAPIIEQAFAADTVDLTMMGDWEDVQIELGLLDERQTPQRDYLAIEMPEVVETRRMLQSLKEQFQAQSAKPARSLGRNEPCWCGSGKKYKHCHMQADKQR
jgi:hypothetical protein